MGAFWSRWDNQTAQQYVVFLAGVLGRPVFYYPQKGGFALWRHDRFAARRLFGAPIVFDKIAVKDEAIPHTAVTPEHPDYFYATILLPITLAQERDLIGLSNNISYDRGRGQLWIRCCSLDCAIIVAAVVTDVLLGKIPIDQAINENIISRALSSIRITNSAMGDVDIPEVSRWYARLCDNYRKLHAIGPVHPEPTPLNPPEPTLPAERFASEPWYAANIPAYVSNRPWDVLNVEDADRAYYKKISAANSPLAFPRAPTGKPTLEGFGEIIQDSCPCRQASRTENLAPFDAYSTLQKKS